MSTCASGIIDEPDENARFRPSGEKQGNRFSGCEYSAVLRRDEAASEGRPAFFLLHYVPRPHIT